METMQSQITKIDLFFGQYCFCFLVTLSGPIEQLGIHKIVLGVQCREITLRDSSLSDGFLPEFLRFS